MKGKGDRATGGGRKWDGKLEMKSVPGNGRKGAKE